LDRYLPLNIKNQDGTNTSSTVSSSIVYEVDFDEYGGWYVPQSKWIGFKVQESLECVSGDTLLAPNL
jgi:hypothetical protein